MAGSRCKDPFGLYLQLNEIPPSRTPGPLGYLDAADPNAAASLGDPASTLGIGDHADPAGQRILIPPLNFHRALAYRVFRAGRTGCACHKKLAEAPSPPRPY